MTDKYSLAKSPKETKGKNNAASLTPTPMEEVKQQKSSKTLVRNATLKDISKVKLSEVHQIVKEESKEREEVEEDNELERDDESLGLVDKQSPQDVQWRNEI